MDEFEYFMALVSVVLAIGIAEIVSGWSRFLALDPRPRINYLFLFWGVFVVFTAINVWTLYWPYQQIDWVGYKVLVLLAQFLAIVFAAHFLTPRPDNDHYDMTAEYWRLSRLVFPTLSIAFLVSIPALILAAELSLTEDAAYIASYSVIVGVMGVLLVTPMFVRRPWYHWLVGVVMMLLTVPGFLEFGFELPSAP